MKQLIAQQVQFILLMTMSGMLLMAGYDLLRLARWWIPHGKALTACEDILYWAAVSVPIFYLFLRYHDGIIRWYGVTSVLSGIILYEYAFSRPIRSLLTRLLNPWKRRLQRRLRTTRRKCGSGVRKITKKVASKWQKAIAKKKLGVYNE